MKLLFLSLVVLELLYKQWFKGREIIEIKNKIYKDLDLDLDLDLKIIKLN